MSRYAPAWARCGSAQPRSANPSSNAQTRSTPAVESPRSLGSWMSPFRFTKPFYSTTCGWKHDGRHRSGIGMLMRGNLP